MHRAVPDKMLLARNIFVTDGELCWVLFFLRLLGGKNLSGKAADEGDKREGIQGKVDH